MPTEAQNLIHGIIRAKSEAKQRHIKASEYLEKLKVVAGVGAVVEMEDGRKFAVVDTFTSGQVRKMTIIDQFELQEIK